VAPIEPTLKAAVAKEKLNAHMALKKRKTLQIPHYKKIEQQKRLFSTKKKTKKTNNFKIPSTEECNQIAISLLHNSTVNDIN
jgi:hypothetical protein